MNKKFIKTILIIAVVIAAIVGILMYLGRNKDQLTFRTAAVEKGKLVTTIDTTGKLNAVTSVEVGSQVSGRINKIYVDFNSTVKKGQLLAKIDPSLFQTQVDTSTANLESAQASLQNQLAQYENAVSKVKSAQADSKSRQAQVEIAKAKVQNMKYAVSSSKASFDKAKAQYENSKLEYDRYDALVKQNFVSQSEADAATTQFKVAQEDVNVAQAQYLQAQENVKSAQLELDAAYLNLESAKIQEESQQALVSAAQAQIAQSRAQIKQNEANLQNAKVNLDYTNIVSPIDGIVIARAIDEGQTVASSFQTPKLFVIAKNLTEMEVYADVDEADIGDVAVGQSAVFTVDAFPGEKFTGAITQVRSEAKEDQNVVTYEVVISAENEELKLKPGMTANITITTGIYNDVVKIPNAALRFRAESIKNFPYTFPPKKQKEEETNPNNATVWILEADGVTVKPETVTAGKNDDSFTIMTKGNLKKGDKLITGTASGGQNSRNGGGGVRIGGSPPRR